MFLTIGPDNDTGFRKHLEELSLILDYPSKFIKVSEKGYSKTIRNIQFFKPKLTIIGGRNWILRNNKILREINGKKGILYCSPLAQAEISNEEIKNLTVYLQWLDDKRIDYLFVGSKSLADRLKRKDVIYLPAPSLSDLNLRPRTNSPKKKIVAIFNDKAIHKNIINTLAGVSISKNTKEIWINGARGEYLILSEMFGLKKRIKNLEYIPKKNFYTILKKVKLLLQISFTEGFSYSAFESMLLGVPVMTSKTIAWNTISLLKVNNCENHIEIARKIDLILSLRPKEYASLSQNCRKVAMKIIQKNNIICKNNLKQILRG